MLRSVFRFLHHVISGSSPEEDAYPSVVLLLESPREITEDDALALAERAWGSSEGELSIDHDAARGSWIIRASDVLFGLRSGRSRYEPAASEGNATRQRAWNEHNAWLAVDYAEGRNTPESEWPSCYKLLFLMVHQLWDENCLGFYLPAHQVTVPNMGDLIASIRWAGRNGTPLAFLHDELDA
jgi:hypothetical protein